MVSKTETYDFLLERLNMTESKSDMLTESKEIIYKIPITIDDDKKPFTF